MKQRFIQNLSIGDYYKENGRISKVEGIAIGGMFALVYYGKGNFQVIKNRPIIYTSNDMIIKITMVHRCGTEVKYYNHGHRKIDDILLYKLKILTQLNGQYDTSNLNHYVKFIENEQPNPDVKDELYNNFIEYFFSFSKSGRALFRDTFFPEWGRVVGHEAVGIVEKVGSKVRCLTKPLGYLDSLLKYVPSEFIDFKEGDRVILQPRCARYVQASSHLKQKGIAGIQLLGSEYEDVSRTLDGCFAQYVRVTPETIRSGCVLKVPNNLSDVEASLVEPTACVVDCLDLSTHPEGQGEYGNIMKKGVARGGVTLIIGSGVVAFIAGELAFSSDKKIQIGGASKVVFLVRSKEKADLGRKMFSKKFGYKVDFFIYDSMLPPDEIVEKLKQVYSEDYFFNDVIIAAGEKESIRLVHRLVQGTGWRIYTLAGTQGDINIESGVWHYSNASTSGTSGCNTRAMENTIRMIERRSITISKFSGKQYSFVDLMDNPDLFFKDKYLRPVLLPNKNVLEVKWQT